MKKFLAVLLSALLVMSLFVACGDTKDDPQTESTSQKIETSTPELFKGVKSFDLEGNEVDDSVFKGNKVTMVNIWGTFCGPCINEMPYLQVLSEEYADKGLTIVGVICDNDDENDTEKLEIAKSIVNDTGVKYRNLVKTKSFADIFLDSVIAVPLTIFLNEKGEQIGSYEGSRDYDTWAAIIEEMLRIA